MILLRAFALSALAAQALALVIGGRNMVVERDSDGLQDIVTWDEHSLSVYGERIMIFSGEFHPFRLPVPDLWFDVFQKIKALGFNGVSFYVMWALLEGEPGVYRADGIFDFEPFFAAAKKAGIFLIARPGPYINAESAGGGFPGWLQRIEGELRTSAPDYLNATENYIAKIGATVAKAQITNGGPVILFQPENEYTYGSDSNFPDPNYFAYVKKQYRDAGIVLPFINNDASPSGLFAPGDVVKGTTIGNVDIYGHDNYPLGFNCFSPTVWPSGNLPTRFHALHEQQSPSSPYAIPEFQAGSIDYWGGANFERCAHLLNMEFERVFYKNNFASGVAILSLYMIFGGTNWGNIGYSGVYTSYDYGSSITENRELIREKYSELKLEANFLKVTPDFLTASVGTSVSAGYTTSAGIFTTPLWGNGSATNFYIVRHTDYQIQTSATYQLTVNTSHGTLTIPQLGGSLTLSGRDSKWHVTDYDIGRATILYSTAEILTWKNFAEKTVLVVYGGPGELHELAIITDSEAKIIEGSGVTSKTTNSSTILNWQTTPTRRVVQVGNIFLYILDRNTAYNYWVPDFVKIDEWGAYSAPIKYTTSVIIEAGYLIRGVEVDGSALHVSGDLNATIPSFNLIGAPEGTDSLYFNGEKLSFTINDITGDLSSTLQYSAPEIVLPDISSLPWKYLDNLPETKASYDDSAWTKADKLATKNPTVSLLTPTSLLASDYGFNTGTLIYRGGFIAKGNESTLSIWTQGGTAYGTSIWLGSTYIGSWIGNAAQLANNSTYTLPNLVAGEAYTFTIIIDNNGLEEQFSVGQAGGMKSPRGILDYSLVGRDKSAITWKLTGNLGGEQYIDKVRGPLNEGGFYAERQGFTQSNPPSDNWTSGDPATGITSPGVAFYSTSVSLDLPKGYDIPLAFSFGNTTINGTVAHYRALLWVNGYQFGKYINHIGPQSSFPVPQGILNYYGQNSLAIELWGQDAAGNSLTNFSLVAGTPILTALDAPGLSPAPSYSKRECAY